MSVGLITGVQVGEEARSAAGLKRPLGAKAHTWKDFAVLVVAVKAL